jgi:CRISPR system Cascade subunit CasE
MTERVFLTKVMLRRNASAAAIRPLLTPDDDSLRVTAAHRLVWALFADSPDRERDFLWREASPGVFYLLSKRLPKDDTELFDVCEPKEFSPLLQVGDRLQFSLRANATVSRGSGDGKRGKPHDVVMNALYGVPREERGKVRERVTQAAAIAWLEAQGARAGFAVGKPALKESEPSQDGRLESVSGAPCGVDVVRYSTLRIERKGARPAELGVLDLAGVLEVREPATFALALARGFGRAKAFGCGLMLIRRA